MLELDGDFEGIRASAPVPLAEVSDIEKASATNMRLNWEQDGSCINKQIGSRGSVYSCPL